MLMFGGEEGSSYKAHEPTPPAASHLSSLTQRSAYREWRIREGGGNTGYRFGFKNPVRRTTIIGARRLGRHLGVSLTLASETFQETGSFQIRAAHNIVCSVSQPLLISACLGNFGRALAYACSRCSKFCIVVLPDTCPAEKVEAIRENH